jgi:hypothetical protein
MTRSGLLGRACVLFEQHRFEVFAAIDGFLRETP